MTLEQNKELVQRFYDEAINGRDLGGKLVAAHQRWRGTHKGEFLGVAATGKRVEFTSTAVLRIGDGRIAEAWDEVDMMAVLQQLGALPAPGE